MKMKSFFLLCFVLCGTVSWAAKISLPEAIHNKLVQAEFSGYHDTSRSIISLNYGKSMLLKLQNLSQENLELDMESGYHLVPAEDQHYQTMVVTKSELIKLKPRQQVEQPLLAMCCEADDASPGSSVSYSLGSLAESNLLGLVKLLEKNNIQDYSGQQAVWVITNNRNILDVYSTNLEKNKILRKYLCDVKGLDYSLYDPEKVLFEEDQETRFTVTAAEIHEFFCRIEYEVEQQTHASLIVIDESDKVTETLFENRPLRPGRYQFTVEMKRSNYYPGQLFYVRLLTGNRIAVEKVFLVQNE